METGEQGCRCWIKNRNCMANQNNPRPTGDDEENDTNEVSHRTPGSGGKRDYERDDEFARMLSDLGDVEDGELDEDLDDDLDDEFDDDDLDDDLERRSR